MRNAMRALALCLALSACANVPYERQQAGWAAMTNIGLAMMAAPQPRYYVQPAPRGWSGACTNWGQAITCEGW